LKKRKHEVTGYVEYQEMLEKEKDIDAVIVASPDFVHAEHTCAALKAGKHVYCEKVMARTADECKKMVLTARETKKLLQIGHQRYSNPRYIHCRDRLLGEAKLLGRVTTCYGQWNRSKRPDFAMPKNAPEIPKETLAKYGFESIEHFLNWRHYKKYGNGPIADLGAHQIGVFAWMLGASDPKATPSSHLNPKSVLASGAKFYPEHEWNDNVLTILEYDTPTGPVQAFYQVLTTTGSRGYFESFMAEDGSMTISEDPAKCRIYSEGHLVKEDGSHPWEQWIKKKYLLREEAPKEEPKAAEGDVVAVYKSKPPQAWLLPMGIEQAYHLAHLQNFFDAVSKGTPLNCPGEVGYANAVGVYKINEAVAAGTKLQYNADEFKV
jgi:predicted dehydrogenase